MGGSSSVPNAPVSAEIDVDQVKRLSHTQNFDVPEFIITRRDTTFPLTLRTRSKITVQSVTLDYEEGKQVQLEVVDTDTKVYATIIRVRYIVDFCMQTIKVTQTIGGMINFAQNQKEVYIIGVMQCVNFF